MDIQPSTYTTDQMKAAMNHLGLYYHSLKSQQENIVAFEKEVSHSLIDGKERAKRLKTAEKKPKRLFLYQIVFQRNPDVVAEVLTRANGVCECCKQRAPFSRASDGSPYLEVHHKIFLSDGGEDTVGNAEALCPNCHRKKHYG
jgi:5-methylcytosine-specific restriction protein A